MPERNEVAVVGGGPAGALLAERLAVAGRAVTLYEQQPGWEKPCGGGLTDKALRRFPFLADAATARNRVSECELTTPAGRTLMLPLDREIHIFSRRVLHEMLLERARSAGAAVVAERVVACRAEAGGWRLELRGGGSALVAAVCNATGARNPLRSALPGPLGAGEWMATAGYYVPAAGLPWPARRMVIRFLPGLDGYIWSFPRTDHASIGICGSLGTPSTAELRRRLEQWMTEMGVAWQGAPLYAHLLPAPGGGLGRAQLAGAAPHPWALVGDAAGLVDPITGEGLYYALGSAELLAEAMAAAPSLADAPAAYLARLRRELIPELDAAARLARRFYHGRFLGQAVLERMVGFGQRSGSFRRLLCDLFSGAQGYRGLRGRLYRNLLPSLVQIAAAG